MKSIRLLFIGVLIVNVVADVPYPPSLPVDGAPRIEIPTPLAKIEVPADFYGALKIDVPIRKPIKPTYEYRIKQPLAQSTSCTASVPAYGHPQNEVPTPLSKVEASVVPPTKPITCYRVTCDGVGGSSPTEV
ncbi:hypothetical protein FQA39_LY14625 [Lamprigera yunnana]|nr:hypothetical protein FQA39_LY14625 [Lamprigera yunnana]